MWASLWDGGSIEGDILEAYDASGIRTEHLIPKRPGTQDLRFLVPGCFDQKPQVVGAWTLWGRHVA